MSVITAQIIAMALSMVGSLFILAISGPESH